MIDMPSLDHLYKAFEILWMLAKMMPITAIFLVLGLIAMVLAAIGFIQRNKEHNYI